MFTRNSLRTINEKKKEQKYLPNNLPKREGERNLSQDAPKIPYILSRVCSQECVLKRRKTKKWGVAYSHKK
jgi:hypothetical protein